MMMMIKKIWKKEKKSKKVSWNENQTGKSFLIVKCNNLTEFFGIVMMTPEIESGTKEYTIFCTAFFLKGGT